MVPGVLLLMVASLAGGRWVRKHCFQIFHVPSDSMSQTLLPGDRIGAFLWPFAQEPPRKGYRRTSLRVSRGDVLVYTAPGTEDVVCVKRCVALPGDVVELRQSRLMVNGQFVALPPAAIERYRLTCCDARVCQVLSARLGGATGAPGIVYLTALQASLLRALPGVADVSRSYSRKPNVRVYPYSDTLLWNLNRWGPMRLPAMGDSIQLTPGAVALYAPMIKHSEGRVFRWQNGVALVDGQPCGWYVFAKDYFFVLGDHRMESLDSRMQGPLPGDRILGKALRIVWSESRPDRFMKTIP